MGDNIEEMSIHEKEQHLYEAFMTCIEHYTKEYQITYSQMLGMIEIVKAELIEECREEREEEDESDD